MLTPIEIPKHDENRTLPRIREQGSSHFYQGVGHEEENPKIMKNVASFAIVIVCLGVLAGSSKAAPFSSEEKTLIAQDLPSESVDGEVRFRTFSTNKILECREGKLEVTLIYKESGEIKLVFTEWVDFDGIDAGRVLLKVSSFEDGSVQRTSSFLANSESFQSPVRKIRKAFLEDKLTQADAEAKATLGELVESP